MYDGNAAYTTNFSSFDGVSGWDIYSNVYMYGAWDGVLFGTSYGRECFVGRTLTFPPIPAETFYIVNIMMKLTINHETRVPTTAKIAWITLNDDTFSASKEFEFDLVVDDSWHLYTINVGPAQFWQGDITNLRIYPFIDGSERDQFAIQYIKISSNNTFSCSNPNCSYYLSYEHPCIGTGIRASVEAGIAKETYTTVSGVNDVLYVDIDNYGSEIIHLGTNTNIKGKYLARIIGDALGRVSIGGYAYSEAEHTFLNTLKITSGNVGRSGGESEETIYVTGGTAAEELGFFDAEGNDISVITAGTPPATGFDYASSRRLKSFEINKLSDNNHDTVAYYHNPVQYNVEGGRRDFVHSSTSNTKAQSFTEYDTYKAYPNRGKTLIDTSHPINDCGRLKVVYINATLPTDGSLSYVYICRPLRDGSVEFLYELDFPYEDGDYIYTAQQITYKIECDLLVSKGDYIAIYNADVTVPVAFTNNQPNASYYQFNGKPDLVTLIDPGSINNRGVAGFCIYARSDRLQSNIKLDIDLGERVNVDKIHIYGEELNPYFEYNVAACLDLSWEVDLHGESHTHIISNYSAGTRYEHHTNIAYGMECLNDGELTSTNGQMGTGYGKDSDGLFTTGKPAYFYVNGDAEWVHNGANDNWRVVDNKYEYSWSDTSVKTIAYVADPISFLLIFPNKTTLSMHKTKMYFKEAKNFESFSISYYLGDASLDRGDELLNNYKRIPSYNVIKLDGVRYYPEIIEQNGASRMLDGVLDLMFRNPTKKIEPIIIEGDIQNWSEVQAYYKLEWNVLEHGFDDVYGEGINITTYYHSSTKIYELEVYSKIPIDPTLLDNASYLFSDYGDFWSDTPFYKNGDGKITANIESAPRYLTLELVSQSEFSLRGIELTVGEDDLLLEECSNSIYLEHAKTNVINKSTAINIENVYDTLLDLVVDLPRNIESGNQLTYWSKLGSINEIMFPEIGPGGILHKNDDFTIANKSGLCSINCPCYGLDNLIDGRPIYIQRDLDKWEYLEDGVHGQSLGIIDNEYGYESRFTISGTFSDEYFKIMPTAGEVFVQSIYPLNNFERAPVTSVYDNSTAGPGAQTELTFHNDGYSTRIAILKNSLGYGVAIDWQETTNNLMYIEGGLVIMKDHETTASGSIESNTFSSISDFEFNMYFYMIARWNYITGSSQPYRASGALEFIFTDYYDNELIKVKVFDPYNIANEEGDPSYPRFWIEAYDEGNTAALTNTINPVLDNSAYFNGIDTQLTTPDHSDFTFGTDDFTVDFWLKREGSVAGDYIFGQGNYAGTTSSYSIRAHFDGSNKFYFSCFQGSTGYSLQSSTVFSTDSIGYWNHFAVVNDNGMGRLFINGAQEDTVTLSGVSINNSSNNFALGQFGERPFNNGQFSVAEFRLSKGIARWTSNFTPQTTPYTTDSGTVVLIHFTEGGEVWGDGTPASFNYRTCFY
jgi:hypothetical protein